MARTLRNHRAAPSHRPPAPFAGTIERLEDRTVPAAFDYTAGTITITLTATGATAEAVTVTNNGTEIVASDGSASIVQPVGTVSRVVVTDTGGSTAQALTFEGANTISLANGLSAAGVERVAFNAAIDAGASGAVDVTAPRSISVNASLTSNDGNITLSANQQAVPTAGNFVGVDINGATVRATGVGAITVLGRGGTNATGSQYGVLVRGAGTIVGGSVGPVTVQGTGGTGTGANNVGVYISGAGTQVTSSGGAVSITGTGGGGSGNNLGVAALAGAEISAGGAGVVTVQGTGGAASGAFNMGVYLSGAQVASGGGAVSVTGTGGGTGGSQGNYGVTVHLGTVLTAGGAGTVTVQGTGGTAGGGDNYGVLVYGTITSGGGAVSVSGTGGGTGSSGSNYGAAVFAGGTITAGGTGAVSVAGTGGTGIGGFNIGVFVFDTGAQVTSGGGAVSVTGSGGTGDSGGNYGVAVSAGGTITAGGTGAVSVAGTGGGGAGGNNHGVLLNTSGPAITSSNGAVSVTGAAGADGGAGAESYAVDVQNGASVISGGANDLTVTADSLNIDPTASLKAGAAGDQTLTLATRTGAPINLGSADGLTAGNLALGLSGDELARLSAGTLQTGDSSTGTVTVASALTAANLAGITTLVRIGAAGRPVALSADVATANNAALTFAGNVTVTGAPTLSTGSGTITFGGTVDGDGTGRTLTTTTTGATAFSGAVGGSAPLAVLDITTGTLSAAAVATTSGLSVTNSGSGTISGVISNTGGLTKAGAGTLTLSAANTYTGTTAVSAGALLVSGTNGGTGPVTVTTGATLGGTGAVAGPVTVNAGGFVAPGAGTGELVVGAYDQSGTLAVELNGTAPGTGYDRLAVTGTVTLAGPLAVTLGYAPAPGDEYVIVANDGTDAVNGTFAGLPEGAVLAVGAERFRISYVDGDGNDVVLRLHTDVGVAVSPASGAEGGTAGLVYTFTRTGGLAGALTVTFSVGGSAAFGADYTQSGAGTFTATGGTVTFAAGASTATVTLTPVNDQLVEGDETAALTVLDGTGYAAGSPAAATGTIADNDTATLSLAPATTAPAAGGPVAVVVTLTTSDGAGGTATLAPGVTLTAQVADLLTGSATSGTDYAAFGVQPVSFGPGSGNGTTQTVTLTPVNDALFEPDETVRLRLQNLTPALNGQAALGNADGVVTVVSDAPPPVVSLTVAGSPFGEAGGQVTVTATLSAPSAVDTTVALGFAGTATLGSDYAAAATSIVIPAGQLSASVVLTALADTQDEPDETVVVTVTGVTNGTAGSGATATIVDETEGPAGPPATVPRFAVGQGSGGRVSVYDAAGALLRTFVPFVGWAGEVRVATGDVTGDGVEDVIAGAGPGVFGHVKVFDGLTGAEVRSFYAFEGFNGGVKVAAGDTDRDGYADLIVGASVGGHVKVFGGRDNALLRSFYAFEGFNGDVSVAGGDIDGDGSADLVIASGAGTAPHVKAFSGRDNTLLRSFLVLGPAFPGVSLAAGDVSGDGRADIVVGSSGQPVARVYDGRTGDPVADLDAFPQFQGGVRVAASDADGDGVADVFVGIGPGGPGGHVKAFKGTTLAELASFYTFEPAFLGGVYIG